MHCKRATDAGSPSVIFITGYICKVPLQQLCDGSTVIHDIPVVVQCCTAQAAMDTQLLQLRINPLILIRLHVVFDRFGQH